MIKNIFDDFLNELEENIKDTGYAPSSFQQIDSFFEKEDLLKKILGSPYDSLVYWGVLKIDIEKQIFEANTKKQKEALLTTKYFLSINLESLHETIQQKYCFVLIRIKNEVELLKNDLCAKFNYYDKEKFKFLLIKRLDKKYSKIKNLWKKDYIDNKGLDELEFGMEYYLNIYDDRRNKIANKAIEETQAFYGINGFSCIGKYNEEISEYKGFKFPDKLLDSAEETYQMIRLYKRLISAVSVKENQKIAPLSKKVEKLDLNQKLHLLHIAGCYKYFEDDPENVNKKKLATFISLITGNSVQTIREKLGVIYSGKKQDELSKKEQDDFNLALTIFKEL